MMDDAILNKFYELGKEAGMVTERLKILDAIAKLADEFENPLVITSFRVALVKEILKEDRANER